MTFVLCTTDRGCENCLCQGGTEERQTKQSDMARRIAYHQRISEEGKLVVGVASVACVVFTASQYLLFLASSRNTVRGCKLFQILPCIVPSVELV